MIGIGIDFGTSNSAVAWFDGDKVQLLDIEPGSITVPTAIHLDREFQTLTGTEAIRCYVEENTERRVEITAKVIGEATLDISKATDGLAADLDDGRFTIYGPADDYGLPGRLFLGIKRLLGKPQIKRLLVFDRPYRIVALITPILISFRQVLHSVLQQQHRDIYLGRPVDFEGNSEDANTTATRRLMESCQYAQLTPIEFYPEPVAASLSFIHKNKIDTDNTILTIDFGGGTLDLSLVHYHHHEFKVLGTEGVAIGGDYIDQLIFEQLLFPVLGKGVQWARSVDGRLIETAFPFDQYEKALLNWTITHTLNQNQYLTPIHDFIAHSNNSRDDKEKLERLRDIILHNYSYLIFQSLKSAKAELSDATETLIDIPEINTAFSFNRAQLEGIIAPVIVRLNTCIDNLLAKTSVKPGDIQFVVRTGGSSKLMAVVELLETRFPGKVVQHDIFTSVASGLAIASYYSYLCDIK